MMTALSIGYSKLSCLSRHLHVAQLECRISAMISVTQSLLMEVLCYNFPIFQQHLETPDVVKVLRDYSEHSPFVKDQLPSLSCPGLGDI